MIAAAPLLGASDTIRATLSGATSGLPISEVTTFTFVFQALHFPITRSACAFIF